MRTVAVVQARLGSTRLPRKVLMPILGEPMLARQIDRMLYANELDDIVVAVPDGRQDDELAMFCLERGWATYRGSEYDVLARYLGAAEAADADTVVRVTADCPLIDPFVIDAAVMLFRHGTRRGPFDFVSNNLVPSFPHGLDVEVMSRGTLAIAEAKAVESYDREHVTPWITRVGAGGSVFRLGNLPSPVDLSRYRLTVDYAEDLLVVRSIYERFANQTFFTTADVITFLGARPDLMLLNARHRKHLPQAMGQA